MPSLSAHLTDIRTPGHVWRAYLTVFKGALVASGTLTATPTNGAASLAVSFSVGSASAVQRGMRVIFKSSGGGYKGQTRVRFGGTLSSTALPVRELARGIADIASGDTFEVWSRYPLSDQLVAADPTFAPDQLAHSDQGANPPPVVNTGGPWVGKVSMLPFTIHNSRAYTVDPDSGGSKTYLTTLPTGLTFATGTSTSSDPAVTGDGGEYVIDAQVTDAGNSKSAVQHVPVYIHDGDHPAYNVLVTNLGGDPENGWEWGVEILGGVGVGLDDIPLEALCVLWVDEALGGMRQSLGALVDDRSHIKAVGYIGEEEESGDGQTGRKRLSFTMTSPLRYLNETLGYSKVMTNAASPDAWSEMKALSTKRAKLQILQFYSTWNLTWDVEFAANYQNKTYPEFFLTKQSPLAAIRELADGVDAEVTCDRRGVMHVHTNPQLAALTSRASVAVQFPFALRDVIDFRRRRKHRRVVEQVEYSGFTAGYSNNKPIFSRWPGLAPGEGSVVTKRERKIADSQADLNARCGMGGALEDGIHQTASGLLYTNEEWELTLRGSYDCVDFYGEYFTLPALSKRGDTTTGLLYVLLSSNFDADADKGTGRTNLRLATAAAGAAGQTHVPLQEADNGITPGWTAPDWGISPFDPLPVTPPGPLLPAGTGRIGIVFANGVIALTSSFNTPSANGGPSWIERALSGFSGAAINFAEKAGSSPKAGWIAASGHIFYVADLTSATPAATAEHAFATASNVRNIDFDYIHTPGAFGGVASNYGTTGVKVILFSSGAWGSEAFVTSSGLYIDSSQLALVIPGFLIDPTTAERAYVGATDEASPGAVWTYPFRKDGAGAWTKLDQLLDDEAYMTDLRVPYGGSSSRLYHGYTNLEYFGGAIRNSLMRGTINTGDVEIGPLVSSVRYGPDWQRSRFGLSTPSGNPNRLLLAGINIARTARGLFLSDDAGDNWNVLVAPSAGVNWTRCALSDPNGEAAYLAGLNGAVDYWDGVTIDDRRGNLTTTSEAIALFGW